MHRLSRFQNSFDLQLNFFVFLISLFGCCRISSRAETPATMSSPSSQNGETVVWSLKDDFAAATSLQNPAMDRHQQHVWHFLRTTQSEGSIESRRWLRDGKYERLAESGENLFGSPLTGWAYRASDSLAPIVGRVMAEYDVGLKYKPRDILVAPGPDYALVIGWQSPVDGSLDIRGRFEHSQNCCDSNSRIQWYVERGLPPDLSKGFQPTLLASGESDFGTPSQLGEFALQDLNVKVGDFIYFIVDARADGTGTPHYGDGTRLDVSLTVRNAIFPPPPSFEKDIVPILAAKCQSCHGEDSQEAKLDLRTVSEILRGGENGPAIVRGNPQSSMMLDLATSGQMPPDNEEKLNEQELSLLRAWIKAGAPAIEQVVVLPPYSRVTEDDREFWAFRPPVKIAVPKPRNTNQVRTVVDSFLLARLEEKELTYSVEVDRVALIRRAYFDLLGLPPEPNAVATFLQDKRENAYELLIDELLKSPHYGERWGRHWLDAAGYVDGKLDNDLGTIYPNQGIWKYRDYVIQAFNDDKPYNEFLLEQIAGDEIVDWRNATKYDARTLSLLTATGFLRNVDDHTDFPQYGIEKRYEVVNETIDMFSTAILGLTMECCRCHNHKYDPLPQRDYYRLMACFEPAYNVHAWKAPKDRYLPDVSFAEQKAIDQRNSEIDAEIAEITKIESTLKQQARERLLESRLSVVPEPIRADVRKAQETKPEQRNEIQKYLSEKFATISQITDVDIEEALTSAEKDSLQSYAAKRAELLSQKKSYGMIQALWDIGEPPISHVHRRGNVKAHGVLVSAGYPEILQVSSSQNPEAKVKSQGVTSGRRLELAYWLTQLDHPLTSRVLVNRVWHHHFGRGIVETLGNFGRSGSLPTHPELLDWLAVDFMENGWSLKRLHRQIMLSSAYRQSSRRTVSSDSEATPMPSGETIDPENRLLWRFNLRRLESEIVRDSILAVSGSLDRTAGGPPVEITNPADGLSEVKADPSSSAANRRSIYLFARRVYPLKFLEIFDAPIMSVNCTQRMGSATVLQSLALLNSEFMLAKGDHMARGIASVAGQSVTEQVKYAFQRAFARPPSDLELQKSLGFMESQRVGYQSPEVSPEQASQKALADLCHMLLSSNEFLYVE
jgi:hypothetical protein